MFVFSDVDSPEMPSNSLELTATWLAAAGVRTVGDMPLRRQCNPAAMTEEGTVPRSDFSEVCRYRLRYLTNMNLPPSHHVHSDSEFIAIFINNIRETNDKTR